VTPEYNAHNLDPNIIWVSHTWDNPFPYSPHPIPRGTYVSGFSFIAHVLDTSPKYYYYEIWGSYLPSGRVTAVGLTGVSPTISQKMVRSVQFGEVGKDRGAGENFRGYYTSSYYKYAAHLYVKNDAVLNTRVFTEGFHIYDSTIKVGEVTYLNYKIYHEGIDISGNDGKEVYAAASGKVIYVDLVGGSNAGKYVWIDHGDITKLDGTVKSHISTRYLHLNTVDLTEDDIGKEIPKGKKIGTVGQTGTYYPHLHFEVRQGDTTKGRRNTLPLNPCDFVDYKPYIQTKGAEFRAGCPVDLVVTDPDGLTVSKETNQLPTLAKYVEMKYYGDYEEGHMNYDAVIIDELKSGDYLITVVPEPEASPTDTFSLQFISADATFMFAENIQISDIPTEPYILSTTTLNTPPETSLTIGGPKFAVNNMVYLASSTPIELIAEDNPGGSGVASTAYRICNAIYDSGWITYTEPFYLIGLSDGTCQVDYNSTDNAGNVEPTKTITVFLDNTPSTTNITIGEPKYVTGPTYVTMETPFTLEANDNTGSGVYSTSYRISNGTYDSGWLFDSASFCLIALADGVYNIEYNSTDNLGNMEMPQTRGVILDSTPPTTTIDIGEPKYVDLTDNIYVSSATPFTLSAEDNPGGSGVASTFYRIYNTSYDTGWLEYSAPFYLAGVSDGEYSIDYYSTDNIGNTEPTNTATAILDNTPPTTTLTIGEPKYISDTTYVTPDTPFTLGAIDTGSGIYSIAYRIYSVTYDSGWLTYMKPLNLTWLCDGNYTIAFNSTDNVFNVENTNYFNVTLVGPDVNGDGKVDMSDIALAARAFGTVPGDARWNQIADINLDGKVDLRDIALVARMFGKHCP
jgi:hypothetical protein